MNPCKTSWSKQTKHLAKELHNLISINDKNWHQLKGNYVRRAGESLSAALIQLINDGDLADVEELIDQSKLLIRKEIKIEGCQH